MEEEHICDLLEETSGHFITVKIRWTESELSIAILDGHTMSAYKGELPYSKLSEQSQTFGLSEEEHRNICRDVLKNMDAKFSYHLENGNSFVWKKKILSDMKVVFGRIDVQKVQFMDVYPEILKTLVEDRQRDKMRIRELQEQVQALTSETNKLEKTLEEFTEEKLLSEQILYGKFVALLNNKKQKVECIESLLFKNLCEDTEEMKSVQQACYASDSDTDVDEPHETSFNICNDAIAGPSGLQTFPKKTNARTQLTDSDEVNELNLGAKKLKLNASPQKNIKSSQKLNTKLTEQDTAQKLSTQTQITQENIKTKKKPTYEMDSQELLDLM